MPWKGIEVGDKLAPWPITPEVNSASGTMMLRLIKIRIISALVAVAMILVFMFFYFIQWNIFLLLCIAYILLTLTPALIVEYAFYREARVLCLVVISASSISLAIYLNNAYLSIAVLLLSYVIININLSKRISHYYRKHSIIDDNYISFIQAALRDDTQSAYIYAIYIINSDQGEFKLLSICNDFIDTSRTKYALLILDILIDRCKEPFRYIGIKEQMLGFKKG